MTIAKLTISTAAILTLLLTPALAQDRKSPPGSSCTAIKSNLDPDCKGQIACLAAHQRFHAQCMQTGAWSSNKYYKGKVAQK